MFDFTPYRNFRIKVENPGEGKENKYLYEGSSIVFLNGTLRLLFLHHFGTAGFPDLTSNERYYFPGIDTEFVNTIVVARYVVYPEDSRAGQTAMISVKENEEGTIYFFSGFDPYDTESDPVLIFFVSSKEFDLFTNEINDEDLSNNPDTAEGLAHFHFVQFIKNVFSNCDLVFASDLRQIGIS